MISSFRALDDLTRRTGGSGDPFGQDPDTPNRTLTHRRPARPYPESRRYPGGSGACPRTGWPSRQAAVHPVDSRAFVSAARRSVCSSDAHALTAAPRPRDFGKNAQAPADTASSRGDAVDGGERPCLEFEAIGTAVDQSARSAPPAPSWNRPGRRSGSPGRWMRCDSAHLALRSWFHSGSNAGRRRTTQTDSDYDCCV